MKKINSSLIIMLVFTMIIMGWYCFNCYNYIEKLEQENQQLVTQIMVENLDQEAQSKAEFLSLQIINSIK